MGSGDRRSPEQRITRLQLGYGAASIGLAGLYPLLPRSGRDIALLAVIVGAAASVAYGRRNVSRDRRLPWTLLLFALGTFIAAGLVDVWTREGTALASWLLNAVGDGLLLVAALSVIVRRGARDLGGVVDAAVIALVAGSALWAVLPHRVGPDESPAAQLDLFVVVIAFSGALGALMRLLRVTSEPGSVLLWLLTAIGLAIAGNVLLAIAGPDPAGQSLAVMLIMAAFTAAGLFGLDPAGPRLMYAPAMSRPERLTPARLVFLGIAVAVSPALIGARELLRGGMAGLLLTVQAAFIAALVMVRIGLLAAERARAEQALEQQATHDPLTHLLNRREFVARLRQELARGTRCVLLFCDLDNFKAINDRYGHDTGDVVLIEVAARLRACLRPPALASRFGGDEFVIVLLDSGDDRTRATSECITAALEVPFEQAGGAVVGVSIGVAHSDGPTDPEQLIRLADQSMYRVKATHRGSSSPDRTLAA